MQIGGNKEHNLLFLSNSLFQRSIHFSESPFFQCRLCWDLYIVPKQQTASWIKSWWIEWGGSRADIADRIPLGCEKYLNSYFCVCSSLTQPQNNPGEKIFFSSKTELCPPIRPDCWFCTSKERGILNRVEVFSWPGDNLIIKTIEKFFLVGGDWITYSVDNDRGCFRVAGVRCFELSSRRYVLRSAALYWLKHGLFSSTAASLRIE